MTTSHRQILVSSSLVGGSQAINLLIGILRGKVLAVLIGPSGIGLAGMFQSAVGWIEVLAGLGLRQAGVRQIAVASGAGKAGDVARVAAAVQRLAFVSAVIGLVMVLVLRGFLARVTFGDETHAASLGLMSLALFFGALSGGWGAVLQGTRRVGLLAASSVAATAAGSLLGLAPILALGERGIAWMHVVGAACGCAVAYGFLRCVPMESVRMGLRETLREFVPLLKMGAALMGAALCAAAGAYATQVLIARAYGTAGVGLYMAAWTLSGFYVQMVMSAMATDFFPRISALSHASGEMNRMVGEQIHVGLLLAAPGLLFTHTVAPWLLRLLTSAEFVPATAIARWLVVGAALRALSWPISYMILAHGRSRLFLIMEVLAVGSGLALLFAGMRVWGLDGSGMAQAALSLLYALAMLALGGRLFGLRMTGDVWGGVAFSLSSVGLVHVATLVLPASAALATGGVLTALVSGLSLVKIRKLTGLGLGDLGRILTGRGGPA